MFKSIDEIKAAVESGRRVCWANTGYSVIKDGLGQWLIKHQDGSCIGLTWSDGETLNGEISSFFIQGNEPE